MAPWPNFRGGTNTGGRSHLRNNLFWRETPSVEVDAHPSAVLSNVTLSHANLRGGTAALDLTGATIDAGTVYNLDPMFTTDHQLRWNSPMMDKGMGTGTGSQELLDFDFDLTNRDIGYHKTKDIVTVTGMQFGAGDKWYKASGNTSFMCSNASIPAGAVIRAETDADVTIETSSNQDLTIGSATGPRTSIVGRPSQTGTPADLIQFVGNGTGTSLLSLYGVLFNYVPDLPNAEDALEFVNMNVVDLSGNPQSNDCTVQFHNYGTSSLIFTNSKGTIRDLDFKATLTDPHLPDRIGQVASAVNVENIVFKPAGSQTSPFALKFVSPVSGGGTAVVKGCSFETNGDWADNYPVQVQQGAVRFEDNTFACDHQPGLYQLQSAVYMNNHAGNDFTVDDQQSFEAIEMDSGYLNLYCGGNHFIWGDPEDPIITYNTNNPMPALVPEWSWNWWGSSCTQGYDMSDYPDAVPAFGWITSPLDNCTQVPPTSCETLLSDTEWLLSHGKDAEEAEYWNVAHNYYRSILLDYPSSKDVPEATGRLKTVGQKGDYGLDYYEYVREDLLDASILSESLSYHVNAVQQECDAWLVEAYNGDCSVTISKLEDLANSETDPTCLAIIGAAQTELKYYSNCDGLLDAAPSGGPSVNVARATARRAMLFGTPEVRGAQEEQASSRPQGISIVSCHPNPFNPVTTIRFQLDEPAQAMVRVFNVKGQEVATLLNGLMSAGSHSVKFGGEGLASGLYLIQVETAGARDVQKVMLVK